MQSGVGRNRTAVQEAFKPRPYERSTVARCRVLLGTPFSRPDVGVPHVPRPVQPVSVTLSTTRTPDGSMGSLRLPTAATKQRQASGCWQMYCDRLLTWPADQPRLASCVVCPPVETISTPKKLDVAGCRNRTDGISLTRRAVYHWPNPAFSGAEGDRTLNLQLAKLLLSH